MNIKRSIFHKMLLLLVGVGFLCAVLYYLIFSAFAEMRPTTLFPLNDPKGSYTIFRTKVNIQGTQVWQYWLGYSGKLVLGREGLSSTVSIPVGHSQIDLQELMGTYQSQHIRVKGFFGTSTRQCIISVCTSLSTFSKTHVVNILEVIE